MKLAIVNQSPAVTEVLRQAVLSTREHTVVWVAHDGITAVRQCAHTRPELLLLDVMLPGLDGVEATRQIMAATPCPIVVVTANVNQAAARVFEAMGAGALDAASVGIVNNAVPPDAAAVLLSKIDTIRRLTATPAPPRAGGAVASGRSSGATAGDRLVAIGASAGGPAALARILGAWPASFPAAVVVTQHVDPHFASGLAGWLGSHTQLGVHVAVPGELPRPGVVLLAGAADHLVLTAQGRLAHTRSPGDLSFRPAVDVFFKSLAAHWRGELIAVLLTGMGRDGAAGLKLLRDAGHHTIAQDEASSAVYGMPKAAAELRAACEILPLDSIAPRISMILAHSPGT